MLAPHPTSPSAARRHVTQVLEASPLAELVDTASLLVSEVVTNAVLHAATDIELSCIIEQGSLCVEVRDRSTVAPTPRHFDAGAMTGRGLGMVELLADEWGVDTDRRGKTVWFLLAGPDAPVGVARPAAPEPVPRPGQYEVQLQNLPVELVSATLEYGDAVLRELALLSIASADTTGSRAGPLTTIDLGPLLTRLEEARQAGQGTLDLVLGFPPDAGVGALQRLALVDEADRMARDGVLLTPPAVPEIGVCRRWLFSQIGLQEGGAPPAAWAMPDPLEPVLRPARLGEGEVRRLDALAKGVVVADDANRILHVNAAAASFLGWEPHELVGQRLVAIVPPALRADHLAGFTRYLLTGEARLLGEPTRLPALRRDGSVAEVGITIEMVSLEEERLGFRATLEVDGG
jgi:PAS domain S-box-containing protein